MTSTLASTVANKENPLHGPPTIGSKKKGGKTPDKLGNKTLSVNDSHWLSYNNDSKGDVSSSIIDISSFSRQALQNNLSEFAATVQVSMAALEELRSIHPVVSGVVLAFRLVVTLYLNKKENDQKVTAILSQMAQMMTMVLWLRDLKDQHDPALKKCLEPLLTLIEKDMKEFKIFSSHIYKAQFAEFSARFIAHANRLDQVLMFCLTLVLDDVTSQVQSMNEKITGSWEKVLDGLDSQMERNLLVFIRENGGAKAFIDNSPDKLILTLMETSGEKVDYGKAGNYETLTLIRREIQDELVGDIKVVIDNNMELFGNKLGILEDNMKIALEKHRKDLMDAISKGAYMKIKDPMSNICKIGEIFLMTIAGSKKTLARYGHVKACNFVLALHEYFTDRPGIDALKYLNITNLHPILQAINNDSTGFITIKEANTFACECLPNMSLLQWITFWAKGWEISIAKYKDKIMPILQEMDALLQHIPVFNQCCANLYLQLQPIAGVQVILQLVKATIECGEMCRELLSDADQYMIEEEVRLQQCLEKIGYNVDGAPTVTLVTGPGRIECYLLPLLYLMLKQHLKFFHYACKHVVDIEEFLHMSKTLQSVFDMVEECIKTLTGATLQFVYWRQHVPMIFNVSAIHNNMYKDLNAPVKVFGFGMLSIGGHSSTISLLVGMTMIPKKALLCIGMIHHATWSLVW
ncbi:hypothetical protein P691DRAFT_765854 [Macrolepiota fuliginosa MF-IS2]|uniref:Uncharacterized protein n=1 Tax=Macrolepiota fuliginosa MF-IS2 TaxID=1400762 RepID=A0A9P5X0L8_9AGAR|nr:hypothetical protein P691DRAFT_765854 [Macrolepiota fuliginosa MF-IS2]